MIWSAVPSAMVLVLGSACFAAFCWALRWHFSTPGATPPGMRLIGVVSLAAFAWFVWDIANRPLGPAWPGAVFLFGAALALFFAAVRASSAARLTVAFATDQPHVLLVHGPYRVVRHPFYTAYLIFWVATATARPGWAPWVAAAGFGIVYWLAGRREEAKFAQSGLAGAYAAYRRRAGMFLPRGVGRFSRT